MFASAAACHLLALDRVQYAALRAVLGALRCTHTTTLGVEADLPPLAIRQRMLLSKYVLRVLTIATHPSAILLRTHHHHMLIAASKLLLPVTGRAAKEFRQAGVGYKSIIPALVRPKYCFTVAPAHFSLCGNCKADLNACKWQALFQNLVDYQYAGWTRVYCDGTVCQGEVACAVWSSTFKLLSHLPSHCSIFTAELSAVHHALLFVAKKNRKVCYFYQLSEHSTSS